MAVMVLAEAVIQSEIRMMPFIQQNFTVSEWEKVIQNLQPKIDDPYAQPIVQRNNH